MKNIHSHRKDEHISLAEKFYQDQGQAGFDQIKLRPTTLPNFGIEDVSLTSTLAGIKISTPFFIQAMTGGSDYTGKLNQRLAIIAKQTGLAMAVGSQSVALKYPELTNSFNIVRKTNPNGIFLANLSADATPEQAQKAVDMIDANALQLHVNPAQELVMPEGDRSFNFIDSISKIQQALSVPLIIKSVGTGLTEEDARQLQQLGIQFIDIGGKGGTNFVQIENARSKADFSFIQDFGLTTVEALLATAKSNLSITATGGIRNASDIIKSLSLGADNVGIAGYFLHLLLHHNDEEIIALIEEMKYQLKALMVLVGVQSINQLSTSNIY